MGDLTARDQALIGLATAIGSNCIPCVEHHVPAARQAGLTDDEIEATIALADKIRQVPAKKVLATALQVLSSNAKAVQPCGELEPSSAPQAKSACC